MVERSTALVNHSFRKVTHMSLRTLFIFTAVAIAFLFVSTVKAASPAQAVGEPGNVEQVVVDSTGAFTLTLKIDEVTTVAIPLRVNWRAQGPLQDNPNQVTVVISPTVLETGIFPVTLGAI